MPKDQSEMVNQLLYGEPLEILKKEKQWVKVRSLIDDYEGWIDFKMMNEASINMNDFSNRSGELILENSNGLMLPYGSFIPGEAPSRKQKVDINLLRKHAERFLGAPYLWGGKTIMGIDCSGLVQLLYAVQGVALPRDASQQVELGETVGFLEESVTGDLAFFGKDEGKITHVGMIIKDEDAMIIHASGQVRLDPIDQQGIFAKERNEYSHNFRTIKRIIHD